VKSMSQSDRSPSVLVEVGQVQRCRGVTRSGVPCKWTGASDDAIAAPLRAGGHFCFCHAPKRKLTRVMSEEATLHKFFSPARSVATANPLDALAPSDSGTPGEGQKAKLTPEQLLRIAEKRQCALERRADKQRAARLQEAQNQDCSQTQPLPTQDIELSQTQPPPTQEQAILELSQAQKDRILRNREEALERRRQKLLPAAVDSLQAPKIEIEPSSQSANAATDQGAWASEAICPAQQGAWGLEAMCPVATGGDSAAQDSARSRTPERRPRRQLVSMTTASPLPLPLHLQRSGGQSISQRLAGFQLRKQASMT